MLSLNFFSPNMQFSGWKMLQRVPPLSPLWGVCVCVVLYVCVVCRHTSMCCVCTCTPHVHTCHVFVCVRVFYVCLCVFHAHDWMHTSVYVGCVHMHVGTCLCVRVCISGCYTPWLPPICSPGSPGPHTFHDS